MTGRIADVTLVQPTETKVVLSDNRQAYGKITIIGVGNLLLRDDGVGVHVVRWLAEQLQHHDDIECIDAGTLNYELLEWVAMADAVLLIDAAQLDAPAGTVQMATYWNA